jgi:hypothetical protein
MNWSSQAGRAGEASWQRFKQPETNRSRVLIGTIKRAREKPVRKRSAFSARTSNRRRERHTRMARHTGNPSHFQLGGEEEGHRKERVPRASIPDSTAAGLPSPRYSPIQRANPAIETGYIDFIFY